jgi:hypothetical protein
MPSDLDNLIARRTAIYAELAALNPAAAGGRPNIDGGGMGTVDHQAYKKGLYDELIQINEQIAVAQGPWEVPTIASPI